MDSSERIAMAIRGKVLLESPEDRAEFIFEFLKQRNSDFKDFTGFRELQAVVGTTRAMYTTRCLADTCIGHLPNVKDLAEWRRGEGIDTDEPLTPQTHCTEWMTVSLDSRPITGMPSLLSNETQRILIVTRQTQLYMVTIEYIVRLIPQRGSATREQVVSAYTAACFGKSQLVELLRSPPPRWSSEGGWIQELYDIVLRNLYQRERLARQAAETAAAFQATFDRIGVSIYRKEPAYIRR
ncbi:MAG: hypothetical protein AAB539_01195 [Patescibacteria group bacterium]